MIDKKPTCLVVYFSRLKANQVLERLIVLILFVLVGQCGFASEVGTISGNFLVDGNGGANYSIPINVPPGTQGVEPALSLTYNSQKKNGLLGMGWSLGGLHVITRCSQTRAQDGDKFNPGVEFNHNDRFCLDGQRLMVVSGVYGSDSSEYRTERDSWSRIFSYGDCGGGPCRFELKDKYGSTLHFGNRVDSRICFKAFSQVMTWALDKVVDRNGNYYSIYYGSNKANGQYFPLEIQYTGNLNTAMAPNKKVIFSYEDRNDVMQFFRKGSEQNHTERLKSIKTIVDSQVVSHYQMEYDYGIRSRRSRIISIKVCDSMQVCLPATSFSYSDSKISFSKTRVLLSDPLADRTPLSSRRYLPMDLNADGFPDITQLFGCSGLTCATNWIGSGSKFRMGEKPFVGGVTSRYLPMDINADGLPDIVEVFQCGGGTCATNWVNDGATFNSEKTSHIGEWSDVGAPDARRYLPMDVNEDGLPDLVELFKYAGRTQANSWVNNGISFNGSESSQLGEWADLKSERTITFMPVDVNLDGISDIVEIAPGAHAQQAWLKVYYNNGKGYFQSTQAAVSFGEWKPANGPNASIYFPMDVHGTGINDIAKIDTANTLTVLSSSSGKPDMLTKIVNGLGQRIEISYKPLTDRSVYSKGVNKLADQLTVQVPLYVVSDHTISTLDTQCSDPGAANQESCFRFSHSYEDAVVDRFRGWLGFKRTTVEDKQHNTKTITAYHLDFPLTGLMKNREIRDSANGSLLGKEENTYRSCSDGSQPCSKDAHGVWKVFLVTKKQHHYTEGVFNFSSQTTYHYSSHDNYNNGSPIRISYDGDISSTTNTDALTTCVDYVSAADWWKTSFPAYIKQTPGDNAHCDAVNWFTGDLSQKKNVYDNKMNVTTHSAYVDRGLYNGSDTVSLAGQWADLAQTFDQYGNVIKIIRPNGGITEFVYDAGSKNFVTQQTVTDGTTALVSTFEYDTRFGVSTLSTEPNGLQVKQDLDSFGRVTAVYTSNPSGSLEKIKTVGYESTRLTNRSLYLVRARTKKDWGTTESTWPETIKYIDALEREQFTDSPGPGLLHEVSKRYIFNNKGQIVQAISPYFEQGACKKMDSKGPCLNSDPMPGTTYAYGRHGRIKDVLFASGATVNYSYNNNDHRLVTKSINSPAATMMSPATMIDQQIIYNTSGQVIEKKLPDGSTQYHYDALGRLVEIIDPLGQKRTLVYNSLGLKLSDAQSETGVTSYRYDKEGNLLAQFDSAGRKQTIDYNKLGWIIRHSSGYNNAGNTYTEDNVVTYSYGLVSGKHDFGRLKSVGIHEGGKKAAYSYFYDGTGRVSREDISIDFDTKIFNYKYNAFGQLIEKTFPDSSVLYARYNEEKNALLKEISIKDLGGSEKSIAIFKNYHVNGDASQIEYGNLISVYHDYDSIGRIIKSRAKKLGSTDEIFSKNYVWNRANKLLSITDNFNNQFNQHFRYTRSGHLQEAVRGVSTNNSTVKYSYDKAGNLKTKGDMIYQYDMDRQHQLKKVTIGAKDITYTYDAAGYLIKKRDAQSNRQWNYSYNAGGQLMQVSFKDMAKASHSVTIVNTFRYNHAGDRIQKVDFDHNGNWLRTTYYFSDAYEMVVSNGNKNVYTKNIAGIASISHQSETMRAGVNRTIEDWEGFRPGVQMASVFPGLSLERWGQFVEGIALLLAHSPKIAVFISHLLWFFLVFAIVGFLLRIAFKHAAGYSLLGRIRWRILRYLVLLGCLSSQQAERWNRPVSRSDYLRRRPHGLFSIGIVCICFLGAYAPPVFATLTPGSNGPGVPVVGTTLYYIGDHLGSTSLVTDERGGEVSRVNYAPFGEIDQKISRGMDNFRAKFSGKELDDAIGLYYMGARYYNAQTGRFITPDPAAQYHSPYLYGNDDPLSGTDPDGEFFVALTILVVGITLGAYAGGAAVNHSINPTSWSFKSGKTWAGIIGGAIIGGVSGAAGMAIGGAELGTGATLATEALLAGAENAAFSIMSGNSWGDVGESFIQGAVLGVALSGLGKLGGAGLQRTGFGRRMGKIADEVAEEGCNSFTAGTEIATEQGAKAIEAMAVGDRVWSYNEKTQTVELNTVLHLMNHVETDDYIVVVMEGEEIEVTAEHPFYVEGKGWVNAQALEVGDGLYQKNGNYITVQQLVIKSDDVRVYNFEVDLAHNYYVSGAQVLVHNITCQKFTVQKGNKGTKTNAKARKAVNDGTLKPPKRITAKIIYKSDNGKVKQRWIRVKNPKEGNAPWDAGHMLGRQVGGSGTDLKNIFPQNKNANRLRKSGYVIAKGKQGKWKKNTGRSWRDFEDKLARKVNKYGSADLIYEPEY